MELSNRGFNVAASDPYFKEDLIPRYIAENHIEKFDFKVVNSPDDLVSQFNCICIVQHHSENKSQIDEIYKNSKIPFIYDCQNHLKFKNDSKTVLKFLGS